MILGWWQLLVSRFLLFLFGLRTNLHIEGAEDIKNLRKPFLITPNHKSMIDSFLVGGAILRARSDLAPLRFMTKDRLFLYPGLNLLLWSFGAFQAHKKKGLQRSLQQPTRLLGRGEAVVVFPEAHITPGQNKLGSGRKGAAVLAAATGVPIVPVSFYISDPLTLTNFLFKRPRIVIRIGAPFQLGALDPRFLEEELQRATTIIMGKIADLYRQDEPQLSS